MRTIEGGRTPKRSLLRHTTPENISGGDHTPHLLRLEDKAKELKRMTHIDSIRKAIGSPSSVVQTPKKEGRAKRNSFSSSNVSLNSAFNQERGIKSKLEQVIDEIEVDTIQTLKILQDRKCKPEWKLKRPPSLDLDSLGDWNINSSIPQHKYVVY